MSDAVTLRVSSFCDMEQFDSVMRNWANATGLATVAMGCDGNYISNRYGFTEFCHGLTRKSAEGLRRCIECDRHGMGIYRCHAGLIDFAAPIALEDGTLLGYVLGGQVLTEEPDEAQFRATARELGIDEDAYIAALRKVNVRPREQVEAAYNLLSSVINQFVRMSYAARADAATLTQRSHIISSLSKIYFCDYYIDLESDRFVELDASRNLHVFTGSSGVASKAMSATARRFAKSEYQDGLLAFADLSTLGQRMVGQSSISYEFQVKNVGWCRALFIAVDRDEQGYASHVIYAIQHIQGEREKDLKARKELEETAAEAKRANEAKSDFLSRMSHDIRTPLNGIIGMTYLTEKMDIPEEARKNLQKIDTSSKFLLSLINSVLDMSKMESGKIELHLEPYPFEEFEEYLDAVIRPLCADKGQRFELEVGPRNTQVVPLLDKLRTSQVVFNILANAVKYTPEGGSIVYRIEEELLPGGKIALTHKISDTGRGMSEEFQKRLFEPFSQENRDDASEGRGCGLGLAIVKRLVDAMGGTIEVKSAIGGGTTFTVHYVFDTISADELLRTTIKNGEAEGGFERGLAGKRILLCEDHPLNQEIARAMLEGKGMSVDVADDGAVGLVRFSTSAVGYYNAILMDIRMPIMGGYEATHAIRALDRSDAKTVPIIAMTADAYSDDVQRCIDAGMNGHIAKPVEPEVLYRTLSSVCGSSSSKGV